MNPFLGALLPALKPFVKQIFDAVVKPKLEALVKDIPSPEVEAFVMKMVQDVEMEIDSLLS